MPSRLLHDPTQRATQTVTKGPAGGVDGRGLSRAQLGDHPQPRGQQIEAAAKGGRANDGHPRGAQTHLVDETRPADEPEPAHGAREDRETDDEKAESATCHKEVAGGLGSAEGPQTDSDAGQHVNADANEDDVVPGSREHLVPCLPRNCRF